MNETCFYNHFSLKLCAKTLILAIISCPLPVRAPTPYPPAASPPYTQARPAKSISARIGMNSVEDPILKADTSSCSLPFTIAGKLILLRARVENVEGNFVLDTGAPSLVLNNTYFRDLEQLATHDETSAGINGEGEPTQRAMVKKFRLGTFSYSKVETDLINLGHLENTRGVKILGLLGVALFKECELVIDYKSKLVHLHHIDRKEKKTYRHQMLNDPKQYAELPLTVKDNRIMLRASLAQKRLDFIIDCGAETNLMDSRLPAYFLDSVKISGRTFLLGAGKKKAEALTGTLSGLTIDTLTLSNLPIVVTSFEHSCFADDICIKGVLGYDFLSNYKIVFNFVSGKLYIFK